ncbi:MAG: helicase-related protein [Microcystis panniformis]
MTRNNLLMRAGSSPAALIESLKGLEKRFEHDELKFLSKWARQVKESEKARQLITLLQQAKHNKTLVFINHRATQSYLSKALTEVGIEHTEFRGDLSLKAKDAAIEMFRESVPVMLASETGGEGRNLQFANTIINYDLPWNPMRIEQRIGRLHRIGQTQDVYIFNFCLANSLEEYILKVLHEKINLFELVVGEIDTILGQMGEEFDFSEAVVSLWLNNQSQPELERAFEELGSQLLEAKQGYAQVQEYDEKLFGEDLEV